MTVPWPIDTLDPKYTSPAMVALGATKSSPIALGSSLYKLMIALAFEIVYENFRGASIALVSAQNRYLSTPRLIKFFNIKY